MRYGKQMVSGKAGASIAMLALGLAFGWAPAMADCAGASECAGDRVETRGVRALGDQDDDGIPDAHDPAPTSPAVGWPVEVRGEVALANAEFAGAETIQAQRRIVTGKAVRIYPSGEVSFLAGESVQIFPGFVAQQGAFFRAAIGPPPAQRFTVDPITGTISDAATGFMWQNAGLGHSERAAALTRCAELTQAGFTDWRLGNRAEAGEFHFATNANGIVPTQLFSGCTAEVVSDGYVRTKRGAEAYGGQPGDPINFMGGANVRCVRNIGP